MDDRTTRAFALAALLALAATGVVAWRIARPQWKRIQETRFAEQLAGARSDVARERERFDGIERSLDYRRAVADADAARRTADLSVTRREAISARLEEGSAELAELDRRIVSMERPRGPLHAEYVRLSGRAGVTEAELATWLEGHQPSWLHALEQRSAAFAEHAKLTDDLASLESEREVIVGPSREAEHVVAEFRAGLDRAEARVARLEATPGGVREIVTPAGQIERCTTCHPGMDDLATTHAELGPASPHQGWGCTVCHGGNGRALRTNPAHRYLTLRPWSRGSRYDLTPVIDELESPRKDTRAGAAAFLRQLTGREFGYVYHAPAVERADAVRAWRTWWLASRSSFTPPAPPGLLALDRDASGRPLAYCAAGSCLRCHESRQRRHVERWRATKFVSFARLDEVEDPTPCLRCHTTGYDPRNGEYAQEGVTCEGCHGPGAGYGAAMEAGV
ncbi:MAG: multiheme c-type cytochrome, partial [Myxococcota bacterium]|nr:multiheme c-type cytochrome [Myxococcota bacterium]